MVSQTPEFQSQILTPQAVKLLPDLAELKLLEDFYLVGGTALSLYLGHRESVDFDFFTKSAFPTTVLNEFRKLGNRSFSILVKNPSALEFILNDVKIFLFENQYPLVGELRSYCGLNIASPLDIGLLKLVAVDGRTTWKDLVDLYFFDLEIMSLSDLVTKYYEIYPEDSDNLYHSVVTHLNLEEIDKSPKPKMLTKVDFEATFLEVKTKLIEGIKRVI